MRPATLPVFLIFCLLLASRPVAAQGGLTFRANPRAPGSGALTFTPASPAQVAAALSAAAALRAQLAAAQAQIAAQQGFLAATQSELAAAQAQPAVLTAQIAVLTSRITDLQSQAALSAAAAPTVFGQPFVNRYTDASPSGPHKVFGHFQSASFERGAEGASDMAHSRGTVAGYLAGITEMASVGIDAVSVDLQSNDLPTRESMDNLFTAADQYAAANHGAVNSMGVGDVKVYFTFDMATFPQDGSAMNYWLTRFCLQPSYYTYQGRPFVSTYTGNGLGSAPTKAFWAGVLATVRAQSPAINPYFIPGFENENPDNSQAIPATPSSAAYQVTSELSGLADGHWHYPTLQPPLGALSANIDAEIEAAAAKAGGLTWMAGVSNQYWGVRNGIGTGNTERTYHEFYGGESIDAQWISAMTAQKAAWIQIITWNDLDEAGNVTNVDAGPTGAWPYFLHSSTAGFYQPKLGLQALLKYYIQWYKTGVQPVIVNDNLIVATRTQLAYASLHPTNDPQGPINSFGSQDNEAQTIHDEMYVTTLLPSSATLTVVQGGATYTRLCPAGLFHLRVPMTSGVPTFTLARNGGTATALTGPNIAATAALVNCNYWWGAAHD